MEINKYQIGERIIEGRVPLNPFYYEFTVDKIKGREDLIFIKCEAAEINQPFLLDDLPKLILDLPNLIKAEQDAFRASQNV